MTTNQSAVSQPDDAVATPFSSLTPVHWGTLGLAAITGVIHLYLYLGGIPYTLAQIGGYLLFPMGPVWLAAIDKVVQVAFIIALAYLFTTERRKRLGRDRVDVDVGVPADDRSQEG